MATIEDFLRLDIRVGKVLEAGDFPEARNPAYRLRIDFGKGIGVKKSGAQLCGLYSKEDLKGRLIMAVVNLPPKQMGPFVSEVLVLGVPGKGGVVLVEPERDAEPGAKLF